MITALSIGSNGRLGNQMFQYASLVGIANHKKYDYYSPGGRLFDVFKMHDKKSVQYSDLPKTRIEERQFSFDSEFFEKTPDNIDIKGYFQTKKYWDHCEDEILKLFEFKSAIDNNLQKVCEDNCFLHVRRTDYLNKSDYHTNLELDYYRKAISAIDPKKVIVFSDDIMWCKQTFINEIINHSLNIVFANEFSYDDVTDLLLMSKCRNAIIANSSFSWWGAYLGPHQNGGKIVAPLNWFGPKGPKDTQDLFPDGWLTI